MHVILFASIPLNGDCISMSFARGVNISNINSLNDIYYYHYYNHQYCHNNNLVHNFPYQPGNHQGTIFVVACCTIYSIKSKRIKYINLQVHFYNHHFHY